MGFSRNEPWLYLSGDNPELLDVYPELGYLRDIVYLLKAFMAPTSDALPEVLFVFSASRPSFFFFLAFLVFGAKPTSSGVAAVVCGIGLCMFLDCCLAWKPVYSS